MADLAATYVLDSFAMLAYFQAEPGGPIVSTINVGEMFYIVFRRRGQRRAEEMLTDVRALPITLCAATEERILAAAHVKAQYTLSYADAFAVALAQELEATLVTGDPEFWSVEHQVTVLRLPEKQSPTPAF
jgi:predicted nucleic acid-binding protein